MLKVIFAVAKDAYGYDPGSKRSTTVPDIKRALDLAGLNVSDDTVRKYLKAASDKMMDWQEVSR